MVVKHRKPVRQKRKHERERLLRREAGKESLESMTEMKMINGNGLGEKGAKLPEGMSSNAKNRARGAAVNNTQVYKCMKAKVM